MLNSYDIFLVLVSDIPSLVSAVVSAMFDFNNGFLCNFIPFVIPFLFWLFLFVVRTVHNLVLSFKS